MKILHTSDWHLGRSLYSTKRYEEFSSFLNWLNSTILEKKVDVLIVAGDIFDNGTPSNKSQELYYTFLKSLINTCCRHIIVVGGNHDSPTFLDAPKEILKILNVYVVGSITENKEDEVIVLKNQNNHPEAIICAIPYLRDRDMRKSEAGESTADRNEKFLNGVNQHYNEVCDIAKTKQDDFLKSYSKKIPIIATGHLFAAGGKVGSSTPDDERAKIDAMDTGEGVKDLYVGNLLYINQECFPDYLDYVALGHLHIPQIVAKNENIRYSGSPIPMGFGEANQQKKVYIINFSEEKTIVDIDVPLFQKLVKIKGEYNEIVNKLIELKSSSDPVDSSAWLEIEYTGLTFVPNLREDLEVIIEATEIKILRINNTRIMNAILKKESEFETLESLNENDVFDRLLAAKEVPEEDQEDLKLCYAELINSINEKDERAI